ncbi:unnamed protein product [Urochloa humidicola]
MDDGSPQLVPSVEHLRYLIAQARPGELLYVEIAPDISFADVETLWEAASFEGGHMIFNPEMLWSKMEAADFIDLKIRELKRSRDYLNGRIGCMQSWVNMMKRDLAAGGPRISSDHEALVMVGPRMYLDLNKIGTVKNLKKHRKEMLDEFENMLATREMDLEYYMQPAAMWREIQDQRSLKNINIKYLEIKIEGLMLLRDTISSGIKDMEKLFTEKLYMGCGHADFSSFRDIGIGDAMDIDQ